MTGSTPDGEAVKGAMQPAQYANTRVLIVDDQREIHDDFTEILRPGYAQPADDDRLAAAFMAHEREEPAALLPTFELSHANTGEKAYDIILRGKESNLPIAVAYVDIRMPPGIDGIETIRRVRRIDRDVEIVIMTAYTDRSLPEIVQDMDLLHKLVYIRKPFVHEEIQQLTVCLVGKWNVEQDLAAGHRRLEAVLDATGDAMAMLDVEGRLVFANAAYGKLLDLKAGELQRLAPEALAARFEERFREPAPKDVEGGFLLYRDKPMANSAPGTVPGQRLFSHSTAAVHDGANAVIGNLEIYRDMSKEIEAERMKTEVLRLRAMVETTYSFPGMVGTSVGMRQVHELIRQAADRDITVLIRGESGTGKELVARSFHDNSPRAQGPFVALDCASIPEALVESELFGHERGAFTGATNRHIGAFERADGGTILLDEIGDMPHALQGRLLRVLQEREIRRVGGMTAIPVDIRVITATNKDLERAVVAGEFREDLFYRISAFPIVIPPLRDRREDIPLLARHFLQKHAARAGEAVSGISGAAMRILLQYDWPGNVRELENSIERAVLLATGAVLEVGSLPPVLAPGGIAATGASAPPEAVLPLQEVERRAIAHALELADRNIQQAAQSLGISRSTMYRKLKKHGLVT